MEDHEMEPDTDCNQLTLNSKQEEIVFQRRTADETSGAESDLWDDTALIEAYDKAIKLVQVNTSKNDAGNSKKKNSKKKKKTKSVEHQSWTVGDKCCATYTEDGCMYDAIVVELLDNEQCIVRYTDYGNEEQHSLHDIKRTYTRNRSVSGSGFCSSGCSTPQSDTHQRIHSERKGLPFIPPPPPNFPEPPCGIDEAMHTMLISWYMSGYHTGYYQGLKAGEAQKRATHHQPK